MQDAVSAENYPPVVSSQIKVSLLLFYTVKNQDDGVVLKMGFMRREDFKRGKTSSYNIIIMIPYKNQEREKEQLVDGENDE